MINTLLLIDDDETTLQLITLTVTRNQFARQVITLRNGRQGIDFFKQLTQNEQSQVPELVFLDIIMPLMDGWDFMEQYAREFSHRFPNTLFCILSSSPEPEDEEKAIAYPNIIFFWKKPLFLDELEKIKKHERLRQLFSKSETT
jgi:CheY-like chemotaxis protein